MELFKKHILFFSGISVCILALITGLVYSVLASLDLSKASKSFNRTERNLKRMLVASPSPVNDNVIASDLNVLKLKENDIIETDLFSSIPIHVGSSHLFEGKIVEKDKQLIIVIQQERS